VAVVRIKRERERGLNARLSLERKKIEGMAEHEGLTIYVTVLLRVRTMTLPLFATDNARPSHVALNTRERHNAHHSYTISPHVLLGQEE